MDTMNINIVYWTHFQYNDWHIHLAATSKGLCFVNSPNQSFDLLNTWVHKHYPAHQLVRDDEFMQRYTAQLEEYFQGVRREFTFPLDLQGTSFQQSVWQALHTIPHGETNSYTGIADAIGKPNAVRAVGTAIGANPVLIIVPCHRVIGKNGTLTGYRGGLEAKAGLLQLEGITVGVK